MSKHKHNHSGKSDSDIITEGTRALIAATADVADQKVVEVRNRLSAALSGVKDTYNAVKNKASEKVDAADQAVRGSPYKALAIVFGAGLLVGFLCTSKRSKSE